jgi:hypothetical protein
MNIHGNSSVWSFAVPCDRQTYTYGEANGLFLQALWDREQRKRVKVGEERTIKNNVGEENETEEEEYAQKDCERNKKQGN